MSKLQAKFHEFTKARLKELGDGTEIQYTNSNSIAYGQMQTGVTVIIRRGNLTDKYFMWEEFDHNGVSRVCFERFYNGAT